MNAHVIKTLLETRDVSGAFDYIGKSADALVLGPTGEVQEARETEEGLLSAPLVRLNDLTLESAFVRLICSASSPVGTVDIEDAWDRLRKVMFFHAVIVNDFEASFIRTRKRVFYSPYMPSGIAIGLMGPSLLGGFLCGSDKNGLLVFKDGVASVSVLTPKPGPTLYERLLGSFGPVPE